MFYYYKSHPILVYRLLEGAGKKKSKAKIPFSFAPVYFELTYESFYDQLGFHLCQYQSNNNPHYPFSIVF